MELHKDQSWTFYPIFINDLLNPLPPDSKCFLFADDIKVITTSNNLVKSRSTYSCW